MNRLSLSQRNLVGTILACCAIGIAGTTIAQDSLSGADQAAPQNRPGLTPATPPTGNALTPTAFDSADTVFNRFDTSRRGYLTKDQLQKLDGFPFEDADLNHDGRLTADEFSKAWADYSRNK